MNSSDVCRPYAVELEPEVTAERLDEWLAYRPPVDGREAWVASEVVASSVRLDRCRRHESALLAYEAERARLCWDDDRAAEAEDLAARLRAEPARTARKLRRSRHGAELLVGRWEALGLNLAARGEWTDAQRALALDLLGVPVPLRDGPTAADPAEGEDPRAHGLALVRREREGLLRLLEHSLRPLDARERGLAAQGFAVPAGGPWKALNRFEAQCQRWHRWAFKEYFRIRKESSPDWTPPVTTPAKPSPAKPTPPPPPPAPKPAPAPAPAVTPAPVAAPTFAAALPPSPSSRPENRRTRRARLKYAGSR